MTTYSDTPHVSWTANGQNGQCEGTLYSSNEPRSPEYVYVDTIFSSCNATESYITASCGMYSRRHPVLRGGRHCLSWRIPYSELSGIRTVEFYSPANLEMERVVVRSDFYDFLGLRSKLQKEVQVAESEQKAIAQGRLLDLVISFFVEWQCDYVCPYCWQEVHSSYFRGEFKNRHGPRDWAAAFNGLRPGELHFSGGEPLLYDHLFELISLIDPDIELSIHSNFGTAFNIEEWRDHVSPDRFRLISLSYHPTEDGAASFFSKLGRFQGMGFKNIGLQMVLHPSNLPHARGVLDRCRELGIPPCFVPYVPAEAVTGGRTEGFIDEMRRWVKLAQALCLELDAGSVYSINYEMEQYWELPNQAKTGHSEASYGHSGTADHRKSWGRLPIFCNAGSRMLVIDPEGYAYVCLSALVRAKLFGPCTLPHYEPIGNVLTDGFRLLEKPIICWESFRCNGDQFQHLGPAWTLLSDSMPPLPIPE